MACVLYGVLAFGMVTDSGTVAEYWILNIEFLILEVCVLESEK